jgi:hypothetical protein
MTILACGMMAPDREEVIALYANDLRPYVNSLGEWARVLNIDDATLLTIRQRWNIPATVGKEALALPDFDVTGFMASLLHKPPEAPPPPLPPQLP